MPEKTIIFMGDLHCAACQEMALHRIEREQKVVSLAGLPLFTFGKAQYTLNCEECHRAVALAKPLGMVFPKTPNWQGRLWRRFAYREMHEIRESLLSLYDELSDESRLAYQTLVLDVCHDLAKTVPLFPWIDLEKLLAVRFENEGELSDLAKHVPVRSPFYFFWRAYGGITMNIGVFVIFSVWFWLIDGVTFQNEYFEKMVDWVDGIY